MNLEERQVSKQKGTLINIAKENICISKTYWFVKSVGVLGRTNLQKDRV